MATVGLRAPKSAAPVSALDKARRMLRSAEAKTGVASVGANPELTLAAPDGVRGTMPSGRHGLGGAAMSLVRPGSAGDRPGAGRLDVDRLDVDRLDAERLGADRLDAERLGADRLGAGRGAAATADAAVALGRRGLQTDWRQITAAELARLARPHFRPGTVAQVGGSMAAFWAVAATGMGAEDWAAIAGLPQAGLLAAAEAGLTLSRAVVVPSLGTVGPLKVLAGLVDAYGLVVAGGLNVGAGDRRRIEARLRFTGGRLITTGEWGGAKLVVKVKARHGSPLGEGQGLAGQLRFDLELTARGGFGAWP